MVKTLLKNGTDFLFRKQTSLLSAAFIIASTYFLSAVLGLLRDRLLAGRFPPQLLGIYWAADRLPSFIFNLMVIGALSSSFIPVFTRVWSRHGKEASFKTASVIINLTLLFFAFFSLLVIAFAYPLASWMAPAHSSLSDRQLLSQLLRLLFLAQLFLLISNFLSSILQSFQRFLLPALSPVLYNLGLVLGIYFLSPHFGLYAAAYGTIIGSLLHLLIQLPLLPVLGGRYYFSLNYRQVGVGEVWRLALPRLFGMAAAQLSSLVDTLLAASLSFASVTYFTFASHLQNLPVSLFGAAVAQAALPTLSLEAEKKNLGDFRRQFLMALHQMTFLIVPAAVLLLVLRLPAVRLAFGASLFDWAATLMTGYVVAFFALSLLPQAAVFLLARGFYALHDTATPVKIGILAVSFNLFLSLTFIRVFGWAVWGLGLSFSLSSLVNALLLLYFLDRKVRGLGFRELVEPFLKIALAGILMALSIYLPLKIFDQGAWGKYLSPLPVSLPVNFDILILDTRYTANLLLLTLLASLSGFVVYLLTAHRLRLAELNVLWLFFERRWKSLTTILNRLLYRVPLE